MPRVTIFAGVSGTGKTRLRKTLYVSLPCVDMADVRREFPQAEWPKVWREFIVRLRDALDVHAHICVEGYFLPSTHSLDRLMEFLRGRGDVISDYILLWTEIAVIRERLSSPEDGPRLAMAGRCWKPLVPTMLSPKHASAAWRARREEQRGLTKARRAGLRYGVGAGLIE